MDSKANMDSMDVNPSDQNSTQHCFSSPPRLVCQMAARRGHLACLKGAHESDFPWDHWTTTRAAEEGHIHCLEYLHEQKCPWGMWSTALASENGKLECLRFLHERGCPWDAWTLDLGRKTDPRCFEYAKSNGCPQEYRSDSYADIREKTQCPSVVKTK